MEKEQCYIINPDYFKNGKKITWSRGCHVSSHRCHVMPTKIDGAIKADI